MYYKNRTAELSAIPNRTEVPLEQQLLKTLCNHYWDVHGGKTVTVDCLKGFRDAADNPSALISEWAFIGVVLLSEFHTSFQFLLVELIAQTTPTPKLRTRHLHRSPYVRQMMLPHLLSSSTPEYRAWALKNLAETAETPEELREVLPFIEERKLYESDVEILAELRSHAKRINRKLSKIRVPQDIFSWEDISATLVKAICEGVDVLPDEVRQTTFFSGCLDANSEYGEVLLSFDALEREDRWNIGEFTHFDVFSMYPGAKEAFASVWASTGLFIAENIVDDPKRPWIKPMAAIGQFERMLVHSARQLSEMHQVQNLSLAKDFMLIGLNHDQDVNKAIRLQGYGV